MNHTTGGFRRETLEKTARGRRQADCRRSRRRPTWRGSPTCGYDSGRAATAPWPPGVLKVIIEEKLYDRDIVENWTVGFEKLREHVATFSLDEVERLTWVPRAQIEEFARTLRPDQAGRDADRECPGPAGEQLSDRRAPLPSCARSAATLNVPGGDVFLTPPAYTRPGNFFLLNKYPEEDRKDPRQEIQVRATVGASYPRTS